MVKKIGKVLSIENKYSPFRGGQIQVSNASNAIWLLL
jgi:hypothetical protein